MGDCRGAWRPHGGSPPHHHGCLLASGGDDGDVVAAWGMDNVDKKVVMVDGGDDIGRPSVRRRVSPHPLESLPLSDDLIAKICAYIGDWATTRSTCRMFAELADRHLEGLRFKPKAPSSIIHRLVPRMPGLRALDMTSLRVADDALVRFIVECCPNLTYLNLAYCTELTPSSLPWIMMVPEVDVRGCWRLLQPSPSLESTTVVELQLLALQQNRVGVNDGLQKQYDFASPANRAIADSPEEFCNIFHSRFQPLINCQAFTVRELCFDLPHSACFLVRTITMGGRSLDYLWLLSRQATEPIQGCWMTDAVIVVEHGLLSVIAAVA